MMGVTMGKWLEKGNGRAMRSFVRKQWRNVVVVVGVVAKVAVRISLGWR